MDMHANPVGITKDIYKITNLINGKIYIGQAKDSQQRFKNHCKPSARDTLIDYAIKKYGVDNFKLEILEYQITNYNEREIYWIDKLKSRVPLGYNISKGGDTPPTYYGINHPNASIKSADTLNQIIYCLTDTQLSYSEIAEKFNTNKKTILGINHGIRYTNPQLTYPLRANPNINGKLTSEDVINIIEELKYSYDTNTNIGLHYGVSENTIRKINTGAAHHMDNVQYPIRSTNAVHSKVTYDELVEIAELLANSNKSIREIAKQFNLTDTTIYNINKGTNVYFRREFTYPIRPLKHKHK